MIHRLKSGIPDSQWHLVEFSSKQNPFKRWGRDRLGVGPFIYSYTCFFFVKSIFLLLIFALLEPWSFYPDPQSRIARVSFPLVSFAPMLFAPMLFAPMLFDPMLFNPKSFDPKYFSPCLSFGPMSFALIRRLTLGHMLVNRFYKINCFNNNFL